MGSLFDRPKLVQLPCELCECLEVMSGMRLEVQLVEPNHNK